jgi:polyisoprenoid-binding protein YceI
MSSPTLPGLHPGAWVIDPVHSEIGFTVRHMMVSKVRGKFTGVSGEIDVAEDPHQSSVNVEIDMSSISTNEPNRDAHLRSPDFFETDKYPVMTYSSKSVRPNKDGYVVVGDLTIKGVTREVELDLEYNGGAVGPDGKNRIGFSAKTEINRSDFNITFQIPMDGGGVVVGDKIQVQLEIEAVQK